MEEKKMIIKLIVFAEKILLKIYKNKGSYETIKDRLFKMIFKKYRYENLIYVANYNSMLDVPEYYIQLMNHLYAIYIVPAMSSNEQGLQLLTMHKIHLALWIHFTHQKITKRRRKH